MSDTSLLKDEINEYSEWTKKGFGLYEDEISDVEYIVFLRDEIASHIRVQGAENVPTDDLYRLQEIDHEWLVWLLEHRDLDRRSDLKVVQSGPDEWWWHIGDKDAVQNALIALRRDGARNGS